MRYIQCFPSCGDCHGNDVPCGKPLRVMVNALVPPSCTETVNMREAIDKLCCVGEFRAFEAVPTIYKPLKGSELTAYLSNHEQNEADMYWGRVVRKFEPIGLEHGMLYKVMFEFNSEGSAWLCRLRSSKRLRDSSINFCFGITLLMLSDHSRQSISGIKYPHVLSTWFQNDVFHPVGYFDSPPFRVSWRTVMFVNATDHAPYSTAAPPSAVVGLSTSSSAGDRDAKATTVTFTQPVAATDKTGEAEQLYHDQSSVLAGLIASSPIFSSFEDLSLAKWVQTMRAAVQAKASTSTPVSLIDLGFLYEVPAVYKDATNTFLPLFTSLMADTPSYLEPPSATAENNDKVNDAIEQRLKRHRLFYNMRRDAATSFLKGQLRGPIAIETAALFTMLETANNRLLKEAVQAAGDGSTAYNGTSSSSHPSNSDDVDAMKASSLSGGAIASLNLLQQSTRQSTIPMKQPSAVEDDHDGDLQPSSVGHEASQGPKSSDGTNSDHSDDHTARTSSAIIVKQEPPVVDPMPNPNALLRALQSLCPDDLSNEQPQVSVLDATVVDVEMKANEATEQEDVRADDVSAQQTADTNSALTDVEVVTTSSLPAPSYTRTSFPIPPPVPTEKSATMEFLTLVVEHMTQQSGVPSMSSIGSSSAPLTKRPMPSDFTDSEPPAKSIRSSAL